MSVVHRDEPQPSSSIWNCFGLCRRGKTEAGKMPHGQSVAELTHTENRYESELDKMTKVVSNVIAQFPSIKADVISYDRVAEENNTEPKIVTTVVRLLEGLHTENGNEQVTARVIARRILNKTLIDLEEPLQRDPQPQAVVAETVAAPSPKKEAASDVAPKAVAPVVTPEAMSAPAAATVVISPPAPPTVPEQATPVVTVKPEDQKDQPAVKKNPKFPRGSRELRALGIDPNKVMRLKK